MIGEDGSSEDEAPEVISTQKAKTEREQEIMALFLQKRKIRDDIKLKRKLKAEKFSAQKKEKQLRQKILQQQMQDAENKGDVDTGDGQEKGKTENGMDSPGEGINSPSINDKDDDPVVAPKQNMSRKFYPKYNIVVDSLSKISNPRATSALNFKERRLAKVHREVVASTVLSYQEKMMVKNT